MGDGDRTEDPPAPEPASAALRGVAGGLVLAAAGVVTWLAVGPDRGRDQQPVTTGGTPAVTAPAATTTADTTRAEVLGTSTAAPVTVTTDPVAIDLTPDVRSLPAGLDCRALVDAGLAYADVVRYWNGLAQPAELDPDGDGEPCERQYPRSVIVAELGEAPPADPDEDPSEEPSVTGVRPRPRDLPSGLRCADLRARGVGVDDAITYYLASGSPSRMDADGNGVPCETVYHDAAAAWHARR